ncbi:MAG TPA: hypothetical protein VLS53_01475, partial [Candidatus Dormibacteraeota bacterium]|nr:hypothetical protein [Candidatus Dormibacteraeota bacterium]
AFHRQGFRPVDRHDPHLLVAVVDYADFAGANLVVDAEFPKCRGSNLLETKKDSRGYLQSLYLFGPA